MLDWTDLFASTSAATPAEPLALEALPLGLGVSPGPSPSPGPGAGAGGSGLGWGSLLSILPSLLGGRDAFGAFMHGYQQAHQVLTQEQARQQALAIEAQRAQTQEAAVRESAAIRQTAERQRIANQVASHEQAFVNRLLTEQPETREDYERIRSEFAPLLTQLGAPASYLATTHPFQAPGYERRAQKVVKAFFANPANQALIQDHPEQLAKLTLPIDRDGTGHPTLVPLPQLAEAAGMPFGVDPDTQELVLYPKGMGAEARADAEGYFRDLLEAARAEGKAITPALRNALRDQANTRATTISAQARQETAPGTWSLQTYHDPETNQEVPVRVNTKTGAVSPLTLPPALAPGKAPKLSASQQDQVAAFETLKEEGRKVLALLASTGLDRSNSPFGPRVRTLIATKLQMATDNPQIDEIIQRIKFVRANAMRALTGARMAQYVAQEMAPHLPDSVQSGQRAAAVIQNVLEQSDERQRNIYRAASVPAPAWLTPVAPRGRILSVTPPREP